MKLNLTKEQAKRLANMEGDSEVGAGNPNFGISDPYFDTDRSVERLYAQYQKHKRLIVAVDFDDTLFDYHKLGHRYDAMVSLMKECQELGFLIVIFTSSHINRYPFIREYCRQAGFTPTTINEDAVKTPFGEKSKVFYNIFLDDKAGLGQAYEILVKTINLIRFNKEQRYVIP